MVDFPWKGDWLLSLVSGQLYYAGSCCWCIVASTAKKAFLLFLISPSPTFLLELLVELLLFLLFTNFRSGCCNNLSHVPDSSTAHCPLLKDSFEKASLFHLSFCHTAACYSCPGVYMSRFQHFCSFQFFFSPFLSLEGSVWMHQRKKHNL